MIDLKERIAYHEAAHATACIILGLAISDVSIDGEAICRRAPIPVLARVIDADWENSRGRF